MREFDPEYALGQFVNRQINVSPLFLGQNKGPDTMGPEYFGLERAGEVDRFFGGLGQSSVDDGYASDADFLGLNAVSLEADKVRAVQKATIELSRARASLREAGRADLVTQLNSAATKFQAQVTAATSRESILRWFEWLSSKITVILGIAQNGAPPPGTDTSGQRRRTRPRPGREAQPPIQEDPVVDDTEGGTNFLLIGGVALAIAGVYLLMRER